MLSTINPADIEAAKALVRKASPLLAQLMDSPTMEEVRGE